MVTDIVLIVHKLVGFPGPPNSPKESDTTLATYPEESDTKYVTHMRFQH